MLTCANNPAIIQPLSMSGWMHLSCFCTMRFALVLQWCSTSGSESIPRRPSKNGSARATLLASAPAKKTLDLTCKRKPLQPSPTHPSYPIIFVPPRLKSRLCPLRRCPVSPPRQPGGPFRENVKTTCFMATPSGHPAKAYFKETTYNKEGESQHLGQKQSWETQKESGCLENHRSHKPCVRQDIQWAFLVTFSWWWACGQSIMLPTKSMKMDRPPSAQITGDENSRGCK